MIKNLHECWLVLIRLPNRQLFDGGVGLHDNSKYVDQFDIDDMLNFNSNLLEQRSYGMDRAYPRYCPNFSVTAVKDIIEEHLFKIDILV